MQPSRNRQGAPRGPGLVADKRALIVTDMKVRQRSSTPWSPVRYLFPVLPLSSAV